MVMMFNVINGKLTKIDKDNKCPKCKEGFTYCGFNGCAWIEYCTNDCGYQALHHNRRKEQKKIEFDDRRQNAGV